MIQSPKITLSMIVRNEERYLHECLESVKNLVDQIVIVDTGSTDNTVSIAEEFGSIIFNFEWENNFSSARNYALSKSTGDWILYLDADERLTKDSVNEIKNITAQNDLLGCRCRVISLDDFNGKPNYMRYTRLFKNSPGIKFIGSIHEQIDKSLFANSYKIIDTGIEIIHVGYNIPYEEIKKKVQRNLTLLNKEYENDKSSYNAFQLANTYTILKDYSAAERYYLTAVEESNLNREYKAHGYMNLAGYELKKHNLSCALEYLNKGLQCDSLNPLLNLLAADIFFRFNKKGTALKYCQTAFEENNKLLLGLNKSALAVGLKKEIILSKGIYYSLLSEDENKLDYFLFELEKVNIKLSGVFKILIENKTLSAAETDSLKNLISTDSIESFLAIIENYGNKHNALELMLLIKERFQNNAKFLKTLGLLYSENIMPDEAVRTLEKSLTLEEKEPASVFYLISLFIQNNQYGKIPNLLLFAENEFGSIPEFNSRFEILKHKLSVIFSN